MAKMGRPHSQIDWEQFDKLCAIQCTQEEIAGFLQVSVDTIERALKREKKTTFADYFSQKRGNGRVSLRRRQFQSAMDGNPTMLVWLGKQYLGQSDKMDQKIESQVNQVYIGVPDNGRTNDIDENSN